MDCPEDLQCCVCIQIYGDKAPPRNLHCGHTVCTTCFEQLYECPECRKQITGKNLKDYSVNIPLLRLCRLHTFITSSAEDLPPIDLDIKVPDAKPLVSEGNCSLHGHPLFFFCLPCDALVCRGCLISEHPDQPYGRCIIKSVEEKRQKKITLHLENLEKHIKKSSEMRKKSDKLLKGSKIAVNYWEKRPENQKDEEYEKNLKEACDLNCEVKKDNESVVSWVDYFTETSDNLKAATTLDSIELIAESTKNKIIEFEKFELVDRKDKLLEVLEKFWNGKKFSI